MALTWGQIKTWSSGSLSAYVGTVGSRRDTVVKQADALQARISSFRGEGTTAKALRDKMTTAHEALTTLADDLAEVQDAVSAAAGNVSDVESAVKNTISTASRKSCTISDNGNVSCHIPYGTDGTAAVTNAIAEVEALVQEVLALADYADASFVARLGSAGMPGSTSSASGTKTRMWSKVEQEKFKNMSPEERAKFWSEQSYEQKQYLADRYPQLIGNADGVEAWARDRANRINLREGKLKTEKLVQHLEAAMRDRPRYGYPGDVHDPTRYQHDGGLGAKLGRAKRDLAAYNQIESTLSEGDAIPLEDYQHGKQGDPASLLTLQNDGRRVKAAVASGDVDHAKHVATFVPGIGTTVEVKAGDYFRDAKHLRQAAAAQGNMSTRDVATIAWLGYDAPGDAKNPGNWVDIASPKLAQAGSDRLAGFMTGMHASRQHGAGDAHMTLVGHSYGSTTSGMAATKVKSGVIDDLVMFGSPGMGTFDSKDFHVDKGHRWVSGVPYGDDVQGAGSIVRSTIGFAGLGKNPMDPDSSFTHLSGDATGYAGYTRPSHPNPGDYARTNVARLYWNPLRVPSTANHGVYLEQGTETLEDIARVVAGTKK